jgi:hypothetical protein
MIALMMETVGTSETSVNVVGFEVLTAASMKISVFLVVALCSLVEVYHHFRSSCCLHHQGTLMMETASTSETLVNFYQTTRRNIPEDSHLHIRHRENLKSHKVKKVARGEQGQGSTATCFKGHTCSARL